MPTDIQSKFNSIGGNFTTSFSDLQEKIEGVKAFIFDWDGVFNYGIKADAGGSPFSEVDSMGLNMLRFSYYLKFGFIPDIYVVTGENNPPALHLSKREHFRSVYLKAKVKTDALAHIRTKHNVESDQLAFMFDDILDMGLADVVGTGFYVGRKANPLLNDYVEKNNLAIYRTANSGGENAVREVCELCIGSLDNYDEVVKLRVSNDPKYQQYLSLRNQLETTFYTIETGQINEFQYT